MYYWLKENKNDFINEIYYTALSRSRMYVYVLMTIYFSLLIIDLIAMNNVVPNIGHYINIYSHIFGLTFCLVFIFLASLKVPKTKNSINWYHKTILNSAIFLAMLIVTVATIGDNIRSGSIGVYIGSLFVLSTLIVSTNLFSAFIYFSNMLLMLYFVNFSSLLSLTTEMTLDQNISIVIFTITSWIFSRYFMYKKIKNYLKRKEREELIISLKRALDNIHTLKGMLPICSSCKNIRDDTGYWSKIENYVTEHSSAEFTHSICPSCVKDLYPDLYDEEDHKDEHHNHLIKS